MWLVEWASGYGERSILLKERKKKREEERSTKKIMYSFCDVCTWISHVRSTKVKLRPLASPITKDARIILGAKSVTVKSIFFFSVLLIYKSFIVLCIVREIFKPISFCNWSEYVKIIL